MKYENYFGTDTLLALRLLRLIAVARPATELELLSDEWKERAHRESLLMDILWGDVSFSGGQTPASRIAPLEYVLHWCGTFPSLADMECKLSLTKKDAALYEQTSEWQVQKDRTRSLFEKLKQDEVVTVPLSEGVELAIDLVRGRQELKEKAGNDTGETDHHPVKLDFWPHVRTLSSLIDKALSACLADFKLGKVEGNQNILRWTKQREVLMKFLKPLSRDHIESWCGYRDFAKAGIPDGARPIETLLAMEADGDVSIEDMDTDEGGLRLRVDSRHLFGRVRETADVTSEEEWVKCADFQIRHKPLSLLIHGQSYDESNSGPKVNEEDKKRRKALRVLAAFAPAAGRGYSAGFLKVGDLARKLNVSETTAKSHQSIARDFLRSVGSEWTISDGRNGDLRMEQRTRLPRNAKKRLPKRQSARA